MEKLLWEPVCYSYVEKSSYYSDHFAYIYISWPCNYYNVFEYLKVSLSISIYKTEIIVFLRTYLSYFLAY